MHAFEELTPFVFFCKSSKILATVDFFSGSWMEDKTILQIHRGVRSNRKAITIEKERYEFENTNSGMRKVKRKPTENINSLGCNQWF